MSDELRRLCELGVYPTAELALIRKVQEKGLGLELGFESGLWLRLGLGLGLG